MNITGSIRDRVSRLRYDYEGGAPWPHIEIQIPYIGKKYVGCKGILICYTLSERGKLHSTVLVGQKCKGGICIQEFFINNEDETVRVEGWSPRHKKTDEHSALEKRQALDDLISCENVQNSSEEQKKSLLHLEDVDYYHENIHIFKLCVEAFIKMPDGTIMLWDRAMSNLCTEGPAKAKKRSDVVKSNEIPEKYPRLEQQKHASHLVTEGSSEYRNILQPHDMVLPTGCTFQEIRSTDQLENTIPYEYRSNIINAAEQGECILAVVEDYEEPTVADSRQVNSAVDENDQNFSVATEGAQNICYSAEVDLITEYAGQRLDSVHDRHESTALASFTAPVDAAPILSEGWYAIPIDSSFDENITITSAEDRDYDIRYIEGILQSKATTSSAVVNDQRLFADCENAEIQNLESMLQCEAITSSAAAAYGSLFAGGENTETTHSLNAPDENITVEPFRPDKETVCAPVERISTPNQIAVVNSLDGFTSTPFDTSEEVSVPMTSAEAVISQKRVFNDVFSPEPSFSHQLLSCTAMDDVQYKMARRSGMPPPAAVVNLNPGSLELPEQRFHETSPSESRDLDVNITPEQWNQTLEECSAAWSPGILYQLLFDTDPTM